MTDEVIAGRFRLRESLGGGMSEVWLADDTELGRKVVVKLLGPDAGRARFEREARAAASLAHPNIVQIYHYGEWGERPYMVLEHLPGGTLEQRLAGGALADAETERIARDIAAGLAHAHARRLVHRDLKPANVLFDREGHAKIGDFGIARLGSAGTLTEAGTILGTAAYISPEQAAGEPATTASDVYSFGVMLFLMLTGRLPFWSDDPYTLARMHQTQPPPSLTDVRPDAPARLESLVTASLAKNPADRPADGGALAQELGVGVGEATTVIAPAQRPVSPMHDRPAWRRQRFPIAAIVGAVLVLLAAGIALAVIATRGSANAPATSGVIPSHTRTRTQTTNTSSTTHATTTHPATTREEPTTQTSAPVTTTPATTAPETTIPPTTVPPVTTTPTTIETTIPVPAPGG